MKSSLNLLGIILVIFGGIWILQGFSILPGSFMYGQIRWSIIGGITVIIGIALLFAAKRNTRA
jgi:hypothetical protein